MKGSTPLYAASIKGHSNVVEILIKNGGKVDFAPEVRIII